MGISNTIPPSRLIQPGVVANTAARPTSPFTGQAIYQVDTNQMLIWNGTAWVIPNTPAQNPDGLAFISEVIYTGSTSASVTAQILGCFSSTYQNYEIVISHTGSASTTFSFRMISGTSTVDSGANYFSYGLSFSGSATDQGAASATSQKCGGHSSDGNIPNETNIRMANPNIAKRTQANIHAFDASGPNMLLLGAQVATTTQYTGIQLIPASGSITGTMRIYGYRQV